MCFIETLKHSHCLMGGLKDTLKNMFDLILQCCSLNSLYEVEQEKHEHDQPTQICCVTCLCVRMFVCALCEWVETVAMEKMHL